MNWLGHKVSPPVTIVVASGRVVPQEGDLPAEWPDDVIAALQRAA